MSSIIPNQPPLVFRNNYLDGVHIIFFFIPIGTTNILQRGFVISETQDPHLHPYIYIQMEARVLSFRIHKTSLNVKHYSKPTTVSFLEKLFGWCSYYFFFCHLLIFSSIFNRNEKKNNLNTIRMVSISKVKTYDPCIHPYMYKICKVYLHILLQRYFIL